MRRGGALIRSLLSPLSIFKTVSSSSSSSSTVCNYSSKPLPSQFQTAKNPSSSSPFESNILRILSNEIQYHYDYAPPHQPVSEFDRFMVEDRPGEQWITLRSKSGCDGENIKVEATMFNGHVIAPKSEENVKLHISMLVDIWKGQGTDLMEFVCSAWPDSLEIQKVYIFRHDGSPAQPYMGPDIKNLNAKLRTGFYEFLKTRGVNDDLSKFLHKYMMNKDRIELIHWLTKLQTYFGR